MKQNAYDAPMLSFPGGSDFLSAKLIKTSAGYTSHWVLSRKFQSNIQILGVVFMPLWGTDENEAVSSANRLAHTVHEFVATTSVGLSEPSPVAVPYAEYHAVAHVEHHATESRSTSLTATQRTAMLFELATQFRVSSPAGITGYATKIAPRLVHERVYNARKTGFLPKTSQGRSSL